MFGHSWRVGSIAGVEIRIDRSWAVIVLLITYSLYLQFRDAYGELTGPSATGLAIFSAVLFFGSVLSHEMAHALVARARGLHVRGITLFLFGGATQARLESGSARDEFIVTAVGPGTSVVLGLVLGAIGIFAQHIMPRPLAGALRYVGFVNLLLAGFNLVPGFPLDGGRLLRSLVWRSTGDLDRATRIASQTGQVIGYLMVAGGIALLLAGQVVSGVWFAAIGWFLAQAARSSFAGVQVHQLLRGVEAQDLMMRPLVTVPPETTLRAAVDEYFMRYDQTAFLVEDGDRPLGVITLDDVKKIPQDRWRSTHATDAMIDLHDRLVVPPHTPADQLVGKLEESKVALVAVDRQILGIITLPELGRWVQRRSAFRPARRFG